MFRCSKEVWKQSPAKAVLTLVYVCMCALRWEWGLLNCLHNLFSAIVDRAPWVRCVPQHYCEGHAYTLGCLQLISSSELHSPYQEQKEEVRDFILRFIHQVCFKLKLVWWNENFPLKPPIQNVMVYRLINTMVGLLKYYHTQKACFWGFFFMENANVL